MLALIAADFVLAGKEADWGKSLLGMLLLGSHQVLSEVALEISGDLVCVPLHVDCGVQMERLVLVNLRDTGDGAVLSLLILECLDQLQGLDKRI